MVCECLSPIHLFIYSIYMLGTGDANMNKK